MHVNQLKSRLQAGETVFGCFTRYPDATLVEVLGHLGWDFIVFDAEHGTIEPRDCEQMVRAAELHQVTPLVRVTANQQFLILRYLDTGAHGLHVPMVSTAEQAEAAVRWVKYHPRGVRGLAGVRASSYGLGVPLGEYVQQANEQTLVVAHLETAESVEALPAILKVEDLDVIFIGPTDLSHSLGVPGQPQHPRVIETMDRIARTVEGSGKALGIMVSHADGARQWKERGARYIAVGLESILAPACRNYLKAVREES